ncbi:hypothetical protein Lbir_2109 [Legionella birminghamensis]|uniref:Membrane-associated HD superfamily hydrolase n=1 Tax=Legionella birminghamensis TaxID=28083 RepID=A0A378I9D6_9GAMM|nr:hypothetical protein [Legionella birminghamensis]KTC69370.1 hypothetical protein Lbir_2109 [Legionella birminghamensis]STX31633.1 Uncharacterised protein [Legionella birminghamensis]
MGTKKTDIEADLRVRKGLAERDAAIEATRKAKQQIVASEEAWSNAQPYWDDVGKKAEELTSRGMDGYTEWTTGASEIANKFMAINIALRVTFENNHPVENLIITLASKAVDFAKIGAEKLGVYTPKPKANIDYAVNFDKDGKINIDYRYSSDELPKNDPNDPNADPDKDLKKIMDEGFIFWLNAKGYRKEQDGTVVNNSTGKTMTESDFNDINQDDESGLKAFFEGRFKMDFENVSTPTVGGP